MIYSKRLSYRLMSPEDVNAFKNWGRHKSSLYDDYNFYEESPEEILNWYSWKTARGKYFTVFLKGDPIGYISFKNIRRLTGSSVLGLVFNPDLVGKAYGEETLVTMLDNYFNKWRFKKIYLRVAAYNKRALALYKKLGFSKYASFMQSYPNDEPDPYDPEYLENKESFFKIFGKTFFYGDKMVLDKDTFNEVVKCISNYKI